MYWAPVVYPIPNAVLSKHYNDDRGAGEGGCLIYPYP